MAPRLFRFSQTFFRRRSIYSWWWPALVFGIASCNLDSDEVFFKSPFSEPAPGRLVAKSDVSATVSERGDMATFLIQLDEQPSATVTVPVVSTDSTEGAVSPSSITFSRKDWDSAQTITVFGVDDSVDDGDQSFYVRLGPSDSNHDKYNNLQSDMFRLTNQDNDSAGFTVGLLSDNTTESGGTGTVTVKLTSEPTAAVIIPLTSSNTDEGFLNKTRLVLNESNWRTGDTVILNGVDDFIPDRDQSYFLVFSSASSQDNNYHNRTPESVSVVNLDNEPGGFEVSVVSGSTSEARGTAVFTVRLTLQPVDNVTIGVATEDSSEGKLLQADNSETDNLSLTFTESNWNVEQQVTVIGQLDNESDGDQGYRIILSPDNTTRDSSYLGLNPPDVLLTNDDSAKVEAGFTVTGASGPTTESGGQAMFAIKLNSQPSDNLTISVSVSDTTEGKVEYINGSTDNLDNLTFTLNNWNDYQTVTLSGVQDNITDGNISYTVILSGDPTTNDLNYRGLSPINVIFLNQDDDFAGIVIIGAGAYTTTESGDNSTFQVKLSSEPFGNVIFNLTSSNTAEGTVFPHNLTFDNSSWQTPQTVTVSGMDDNIADDKQNYKIQITPDISSADSNYRGLPDHSVEVANLDDEMVGFEVSAVSGNTNESGDNATFTVKLRAQPPPGTNVFITVSSGNPSEGIVSPDNLTFTDINWNVSQTITVTGVDDDLIDGYQTFAVLLGEALSNNLLYNGKKPPEVRVTNVDDESRGYTIGNISGPTTEKGGVAFFTIHLNSKPTDNVTIPVSSSDITEGTVSQDNLTDIYYNLIFTPSSWSVDQVVTVFGQDDLMADGDQAYRVVLGAAVSEDGIYNGLAPPDVHVSNTDNEEAGYVISAVSGSTTESGGKAMFAVRLKSQPFGSVTIGVSSDNTSEGTVSPSSLTFNSTNWNTFQSVTLTGVDDSLTDGNQTYSVTLTVDNVTNDNDSNYRNSDPEDLLVTNLDDEIPNVLVSAVNGNISESGLQTTFTIKLNSQPTDDVRITFTVSDSTEGLIWTYNAGWTNSAFYIFTPSNWNTPDTVTLKGVDDNLTDGNQSFTVQIVVDNTTADSDYKNLDPPDLTVLNLDDDVPGFVIGAVSGNTSESGDNATFTVRLQNQPTDNVTIALYSSNVAEGTVSLSQLVFSSDNFSVDQTVTVTGVDDDIIDGYQTFTVILAAASSNNAAYNGLDPTDVIVTNRDNEGAGFTIGPVSGNSREDGGVAFFTVRLNSQPQDNVTISLASDNTSEGTVSPTQLVFTASNWEAVQVVTATGQDDAIADGNQPYRILLDNVTSADLTYNNLNPPDVYLINIDDETAGFTLSPVSGSTTESGGKATFSIRLNSQPTSSVSISLLSDNTSEVTVSPDSLTFTPANWKAYQQVNLAGADDNQTDGNQAVIILLNADNSTSDTSYLNLDPADVFVTNIDDETAGFLVSSVSGSTSESGGTAVFTVRLGSQPTGNVILSISSSDSSEGQIYSIEGVTGTDNLSFTTTNWNANQEIILRGVDDNVSDGNQGYRITFSAAASSDSNYNGLRPEDLMITNLDDESPGFNVSSVSGDTDENGTEATFTLRLRSQPTDNVILYATTSDESEGLLFSDSGYVTSVLLTFTPQNWNSYTTIRIRGQADNLSDGDQSYSIRLSADNTSSDLRYKYLDPPDVTLRNLDVAAGGFYVSAVSGDTDENGNSANFTVRLRNQPTDDVTVYLATSDATEGSINAGILSFTSVNWNAMQTVTITGVADNLSDGDQSYAVILSADNTSADLRYKYLDPPDVTLRNLDVAAGGFYVSAVSGDTDENGNTASFTVHLRTQPTDEVTVYLATSDATEGSINAGSLGFTSVNWNAMQTVTITGVADNLSDGDQSYAVILSADNTSADLRYKYLDPPDVTLRNLDTSQSAGFQISSISGNTSESGDNATFTVRLKSEPQQNVTLSFSSSDTTEGDLSPGSLTFGIDNWSMEQTVTLTGIDDAFADGDQSYHIAFSASTAGDLRYHGLKPEEISLFNLDNESAGFVVGAISGNTSESGDNATFTVKLTSQPTDNVTLVLSSDDVSEGEATPQLLRFSTSNWNTLQTVTVSGLDDQISDGNQGFRILLDPAYSSDSGYNGLDPNDVSVVNEDNDNYGFYVSAISGSTSESGGTAQFSVVLTHAPTTNDNVTLTLSTSDSMEGLLLAGDNTSIPSGSLIFTSSNWASAQTVVLQGVNDNVSDGDQAYRIAFANTTSGSGNYYGSGKKPQDVLLSNRDDDTVGVHLSSISGNTTESGTTALFTVQLQSEPTDSVTLPVSSSDTTEGLISVDAGNFLDSDNLTFTPSAWNQEKTIWVQGQDDNSTDGDQAFLVQLGAIVSNDRFYNGLNPLDIPLMNLDQDAAASIVVNPTSAVTSEEGEQANFTVRLGSQPSGNVYVTVTSLDDSEGAIQGSDNLTFTPQNWNGLQVVTVQGTDDNTADGTIAYQIRLAADNSSADTNYNDQIAAFVLLKNYDNEQAGYKVSAISGTASESGEQAFFTVRLTSRPSASVTPGVASDNTGEGAVSPESLTFTTANWSSEQVIRVSGVDDSLNDGTQSFMVVLSADNSTSDTMGYLNLDPPDVLVTNLDDETPGFTVSASSGSTSESGGSAMFTVKLNSVPSGNVVFDLSISNDSEGSFTSGSTDNDSSLTFTSGNWNAVQTVIIYGLDDSVVDGTQAYLVTLAVNNAGTADSDYTALAKQTITLNNIDDETAGFVVSSASGNTAETGAGAIFTVRLTSRPNGTVRLLAQDNDTSEGLVSPSYYDFTNANWNGEQVFTVTGVDDNLTDGDQGYRIELSVDNNSSNTTDTSGYLNMNPPDVLLTNVDDENAGFTLHGSGSTTETGGVAVFWIRLNSAPAANVTLYAVSSDAAEGKILVDGSDNVTTDNLSIVFTTENWSSEHAVRVKGQDDSEVDGNQGYRIALSAAVSGDANYDGLNPPDVLLNNLDDESAGFIVSAASGNTREFGDNVTFTVRLTSRPLADVTLPLESSDSSEGLLVQSDNTTAGTLSLTIETSNWSSETLVTVSGQDDLIRDGHQPYRILLNAVSSADLAYNGLNPPDVLLVNEDDETAGFRVDNVTGLTTSESADNTSFYVRLTTAPLYDVVIPLYSNDISEGTVSSENLTFTPANWSDNQSVTVTGEADTLEDGSQQFLVILAPAASLDPAYHGLNPPDVLIVNTASDRDFTVSSATIATTEMGGTDSFTVVLTKQPDATVTIPVSSTDTTEATVSPDNLSFTIDNWNTAQTVTVAGVDDFVDDDNESYSIIVGPPNTFATGYSGLSSKSVSGINTDNDSLGISVGDPSANSFLEGGSATISVVLTSEPTDNVTINISSDNTTEGVVSPGQLVFSSLNWNTAQTVTVTGVDDGVVSGSYYSVDFNVIFADGISNDINYNGLSADNSSISLSKVHD